MMKQDQVLDAHFGGDLHTLEPGGMTPPLARGGQLLGSELRSVDENIRARRELAKALVEFRIARLVVSSIYDRPGRCVKAKTQAALWVMQPACLYTRAGDFNLISAADFGEVASRRHGADIDGKIGMRHLRLKNALQAIASEILGPETIELQTVLLRIEWRKERNSLNVIPVVVRHKNVRFHSVQFRLRFEVPSEHSEPSSTIQNYASPC